MASRYTTVMHQETLERFSAELINIELISLIAQGQTVTTTKHYCDVF